MPYSPPAYNAVIFNFTTGGYSPPAYNSIIFNFGGSPAPSAALPWRRLYSYQDPEEPSYVLFPRRVSIATVSPVVVPAFLRRGMWIQEDEQEPRAFFLTCRFVVVIDDDDVMVTMLI